MGTRESGVAESEVHKHHPHISLRLLQWVFTPYTIVHAFVLFVGKLMLVCLSANLILKLGMNKPLITIEVNTTGQ